MSDKVEKLLTRLGNIWPKRIDDDNLTEWLADWESALGQFDGWVLEAAATRIVHDRTQAGLPFPAEVRKVCYQVLADDKRGKPSLEFKKAPSDTYKLADELIMGPAGKRAAQEGWALTLRDFIALNGRLPDLGEIRKLITTKDKFIRNLGECHAGRGGEFGKALTVLGDSMARREKTIADRIMGVST